MLCTSHPQPGFGGPKPPAPKLPMSTDNCTLLPLLPTNSTTTSGGEDEEEYFYLYRISYAWYSFLGRRWIFFS